MKCDIEYIIYIIFNLLCAFQAFIIHKYLAASALQSFVTAENLMHVNMP